MSDSTPFTEYLSEVLSKAEGQLNEGDYLTLANALKDAHKKSNDGKPPRTPYIYFPINITMILNECSGGIKSCYISFTEVGGNNLTAPYPSTIHTRGTINISYEDKCVSNPIEWYSSQSTINVVLKMLEHIEPSTIESNIYNIKRIDKFEDWKKERSRYKNKETFYSTMVNKVYNHIYTIFWSEVNKQRADGDGRLIHT
jgi:hypothetical protein